MTGGKIAAVLIVGTLLAGCGNHIHHITPESPLDQWEKVNELTDSVESRLTLVSGHQLIVRDIVFQPDSTSFVGPDQGMRLLITTDQIAGATVLKRGRSAGADAAKSAICTGGILALLGYLGGDDPQEGWIRWRAEDKALAGLILGSTVGGLAGYVAGAGARDSVSVDYGDAIVPVTSLGSHPGEPGPGTDFAAGEKIEFYPGGPVPHVYGKRTHWRSVCTLGYATGLAGAGWGLMYLADQESGWEATPIAFLGGIAGFVGGQKIGGAADNALFLGRPLSGKHRNGVRLGTVLAGAGSSLIATYYHMVNSDDNYRGGDSDTEVARKYALWGAGLGLLAQIYFDSGLYPHNGENEARLSLVPEGRFLALRYSFD